MSGELENLPSDTSYNKEAVKAGEGRDENIGPSIDNPETQSKPGYNNGRDGFMSPYYRYSVAEMAQMVNKKPVTVRLEARTKHIGTKRANGEWEFTHEDRERMQQSFLSKPKARQPSDNIGLLGSILQRQDFLATRLKEMEIDRQRSAFLFRDVHDEWMRRFEEIGTKLDAIKKRIRELEGERK